ncbi:sulfatase [bacterium]|nr:sulfatase [bacterium]
MIRTLLFVTFFIGSAVPSFAGAKSVLLIIADDLGGGDLGCYGNSVVRTPAIDALASQGTRFTHAFATTASCSPSRSVLYTGLQTHTSGQYGLAHPPHSFRTSDKVKSVFTYAKQSGARVGVIGKKHVEPASVYPTDFEPQVGARNVSRVAGLAEEFLAETGDKPFLLVVGFVDPHRDFENTKPHPGVEEIKYKPANVIVPSHLPDIPEVRQDLAEYYQSISRMDQGVGKVLSALEASGRANDTMVIFTSDNGMPFAGAKTNVYEPAIRLPFIVRLPDKDKPSSDSKKSDAMISFVDVTPTILDWLGALPEDKGKKPAFHGRSILPLLSGEGEASKAEDWNKVYCSHTFHEVTMYYPMRVVRTRNHKLIQNLAHELSFPLASDLYRSPTWQAVLDQKLEKVGQRSVQDYLHRPAVELYDLASDPRELVNLADDPKYAAIRKELESDLKAYRTRTQDPWLEPESYQAPASTRPTSP